MSEWTAGTSLAMLAGRGGWFLLACCACMMLLSGCASPWQPRGETATASASVSPNGSLSKAPLQVSNQPFGSSQSSSSWSSALQGATSSMAEALTIKPRVIPADDPVSLSTEPANLGPEFHLQLARYLEHGDQPAAARKQYELALRADPENVDALVGCGRLLDRLGQAGDAQKMYRRAVAVDPQHGSAYNDLGISHARQGQTEPALEALRKAVELAPENARYRNNLAAVLVQANQPDSALLHLRQVHAEPIARYNLGCLLSEVGQSEAARREFAAALHHDPQLAPARAMLARWDAPAIADPRSMQLAGFQQPDLRRLPAASARADIAHARLGLPMVTEPAGAEVAGGTAGPRLRVLLPPEPVAWRTER
ncbi:MAG: tetratricopeptide repeat protein [Pirellulaceae bacterium]|nr:tetratricopeptide repeat protein [Pirellulaceae bacterium]